MLKHSNYVHLTNMVRSLSTSSILSASHYDVLGITPKATQRDIKDAYYNLSKLYHPDKSNDEESAKKFRDISEAYEILGNVKLKKMYDKGLYTVKDKAEWKPEAEPTDPNLRFYKSRVNQMSATIRGTTTPVYNFDQWSQQHYSNLFETRKQEVEFNIQKNKKKSVREKSMNQEVLMLSLLALTMLFMFAYLQDSDLDVDRTKNKK